MYNPESVLENEKHKLLCNFKIQTHRLIPARQPDLMIIKKIKKKKKTDNMPNGGFYQSAEYSKIKESEKRDKYQYLAREHKTIKHVGDGVTNCNWSTWNNSKMVGKENGTLRNKRTRGDNRD